MPDLAPLVSATMRTTSMHVAEVFGKQHAHILRAVAALESGTQEARAFNRSNFGAIDFVDGRGRTQPGIEMTRDGFTVLTMGMAGKRAYAWKLKYLAAFNAMEANLAKEADKLEWKAARLGVKQVRRSFTNTVAAFVAYAKAQGSQSADRYYSNLTTMEYKALGLLEMQKSALGNFRDTLDLMDIAYLNVAEITAKVAIEEGMAAGVHYKEIYQLAKQRVTDYANVVTLSCPSKYVLVKQSQ
jgi:Rha family phage regulatory protein